MAEDVNSDPTRARQFDVVRRGYDRAQVDATLQELQVELSALNAQLSEVTAEKLSIGIDDKEALANELTTIGGEISQILEAARATAEGLRSRAATDAETWRADAEAETTSAISAAKEQTLALRSSAWNEGSALLNSAAAEVKKILAAAQEDALFMRAEAERDALRLTSDARRDKEEALRSARQEAEVILSEARAESDGVLAAAQKQAELAQDRARALEDRRSELLAELEATRSSISHLEEEIDSRRQELEAPPEPEPIVVDDEMRGLDVGSVKIVAPSKAMTLRPVDPDELVAEVTAMRASSTERAAAQAARTDTVAVISPPDPVPVQPAPQPAAPDVTPEIPASTPESDHPQQGDQTVVEPVPPHPATVSESVHVPAENVPEPVAPEQPAGSLSEPPPTEPGTTDVSADATSSDEIGSLFAALRSQEPSVSTGQQPRKPTTPVEREGATVQEPAQTKPEQSGVADAVTAETSPQRDSTQTETSALPQQEGAEVAEDEDFDAEMLAVRNAALKEIKRSLVDLQNETLEALRTDETWTPGDDFMNRFDEPFTSVAQATGEGNASDLAGAFASDLHDSVLSALEDARSAGSGARAVAAAASKVFRTWRSDEAERRLQRL